MKLWRNAAGKLIRGSDGKLVRCAACPCATCPDAATLTLALSAIIPCADCFSAGDGTYFHINSLALLNAIHSLTQTLPAVSWSLPVNLDIPVTFYTDAACTMGATPSTIPATVDAACGGNGVFAISSSLLAADVTYPLFTATGVALGISASNALVTCDGATGATGGNGSLSL